MLRMIVHKPLLWLYVYTYIHMYICVKQLFIHFVTDTKPNDSTEVCNPKCKPGQCCREGKCFCLDTTNMTMNICPGLYSHTVQLDLNLIIRTHYLASNIFS